MPIETGLQPAEALLRRMESVYSFTEDEKEAVARLPFKAVDVGPHRDIVNEGHIAIQSCVVVAGITCWSKLTSSGKRQITSVAFSGDMPDLHGYHLKPLDSNLSTITPCRLGFVSHDALKILFEQQPNVASAMWRLTLIDAAVFREWVTNVGGRPAYSRIAHLFCEFFLRASRFGLRSDGACSMPLTQTEIGECTGLSTVHVNRNIQQLRAEKLISLEAGVLTVLDWEGLQAAGDFDPASLHQTPPPVAATRNRSH